MKTILLKTSIDYSFSRNKSPAEPIVKNKSDITFSTSSDDKLNPGDYVKNLDEYQFNALIQITNVNNITWQGSLRVVFGYIPKSVQYDDLHLIRHTLSNNLKLNKEYSFTEFYRRLKNTIKSNNVPKNIDVETLKLKDIYVYAKNQDEANILVDILKEYGNPDQVKFNSNLLTFKIGVDEYNILKLRTDGLWMFGSSIDDKTKIDIETFKKLLIKERKGRYGRIS